MEVTFFSSKTSHTARCRWMRCGCPAEASYCAPATCMGSNFSNAKFSMRTHCGWAFCFGHNWINHDIEHTCNHNSFVFENTPQCHHTKAVHEWFGTRVDAGCFTRPERQKKLYPPAQRLSATFKFRMHSKIKRAVIASDEPQATEGTTAHGYFVFWARPAQENIDEIFMSVVWA